MNWLVDHFKIAFLFTPLASRNIAYGDGRGGYTGYTDIFIFGLRVLRVQRTTPW